MFSARVAKLRCWSWELPTHRVPKSMKEVLWGKGGPFEVGKINGTTKIEPTDTRNLENSIITRLFKLGLSGAGDGSGSMLEYLTSMRKALNPIPGTLNFSIKPASLRFFA